MVIFLIYLFILGFLLLKIGFFRLANFHGKGLYIVLIIKLLIAVVLFHFPLDNLHDSQIYLKDSQVLSHLFWQNPVDFFKVFFHVQEADKLDWKYMLETNFWSHESGNFFSEKRNVIRINAIFHLISFQNPHIVFLWNTILSILGLKLFYLSLNKWSNDRKNLLFFILFFLPSTLLWTSNIMKENYMVLGLGLIFYGLLVVRHILKQLIFIFFGVLILFMFRQYVGFAFIIALIIYALFLIQNQHARLVALASFAIVTGLIFYTFLPKFTEKISQKQFDFIQLAQGGIVLNDFGTYYHIDNQQENHFYLFQDQDNNYYAHILQPVEATRQDHTGMREQITLEASDKKWYVYIHQEQSGSYIAVNPIQNKELQLIKNIPEAIINACFRPWPNDPPKSLFKWYFVFENLCVWLLLIFGLAKFKESIHKKMFLFVFLACLIMALFVGWTTPVLGAIVRYKLPIVLTLVAISWLLLFPKNHTIQNETT